MSRDDRQDADLREDIVRRLGRRQSTAAVLFNHAVAERLGLGPTDHKCLDLLLERGPLTGTELAAITGLTTGAVTGVVARLERAGFVRRNPDPRDRRKQILSADTERFPEIDRMFAAFRQDVSALLERFDHDQLDAIAAFLRHSTESLRRHAALLRADAATWPDDGSGSRAPAGHRSGGT